MIWLGERRGYATDWATQLWVAATGKATSLEENRWLAGPVGDTKRIGGECFRETRPAGGAFDSGRTRLGVAMFMNARDGYPAPLAIQTPTRPNGGGISHVFLAPLGDQRLDTFHNDTIQSVRRTQTANNANLISAIVAPRVVRFGARPRGSSLTSAQGWFRGGILRGSAPFFCGPTGLLETTTPPGASTRQGTPSVVPAESPGPAD
jgi:hypothetical protein